MIDKIDYFGLIFKDLSNIILINNGIFQIFDYF